MKATARSHIPDYANMLDEKMEGLAKEDRAQPGDPEKLVRVVVDLVRREGVAEGKKVPLRIPLGEDCFTDVKAKCEETLKVLEDWESVSRSTDFSS